MQSDYKTRSHDQRICVLTVRPTFSHYHISNIFWLECQNKEWFPNKLGTRNEVESRYSQPKLELFGLYRALHSFRIHLIRVKNLIVEVDTQYIKGMLNAPDLAPNNVMNRWIQGIMIFDFVLKHVPGKTHLHRLPTLLYGRHLQLLWSLLLQWASLLRYYSAYFCELWRDWAIQLFRIYYLNF